MKILLNVITDQELKKEIKRIRSQKKLSDSKNMISFYEAQLLILQRLYFRIKRKYLK